MTTMTRERRWTPEAMAARVVRYAELQPCYNAFIDTRTPGSEAKENFTIIGPGVSENPDQHVHIAEPHGFNIGGARQPPGCVNSQHSHDTAESFVVHTGHWRFDLGEHGGDASVEVGPGDVISIPTRVFRGFTNISEGTEPGFLFGLLGGDDPGKVLWAPRVFDMAKDYGLVLLENGSLVDTARGQAIPADAKPMPRTSPEQVAAMLRPSKADAERLVWREGRSSGTTAIIGEGAPLGFPHPYTLDRIDIGAGETLPAAAPDAPEVLFVQAGQARLAWDGGALELGTGDTMTVPVGLPCALSSGAGAAVYRVGGAASA